MATNQDLLARIQEIKQRYAPTLLRKKNVVGLGIGYREVDGQPTDQLSLVVMVERKLDDQSLDPEDRIPTELEGIPVDVREVGKLRAF